jgi:hypothetical protein
VIYADIVCLNFDGNLYDACLLALVQSLRRLQIPDTEVVEEGLAGGRGGKVASEVCISSTNFRTLPVHHTITSTTFGVIDRSERAKGDTKGSLLRTSDLLATRSAAACSFGMTVSVSCVRLQPYSGRSYRCGRR